MTTHTKRWDELKNADEKAEWLKWQFEQLVDIYNTNVSITNQAIASLKEEINSMKESLRETSREAQNQD